jgi:predicted HTH domain antitoxin
LKTASTVVPYKKEKRSLSREAEIAGVSLDEFKEIFADRGVVRTLYSGPEIDDNVAMILEERD